MTQPTTDEREREKNKKKKKKKKTKKETEVVRETIFFGVGAPTTKLLVLAI
jgi:hypothetical protein